MDWSICCTVFWVCVCVFGGREGEWIGFELCCFSASLEDLLSVVRAHVEMVDIAGYVGRLTTRMVSGLCVQLSQFLTLQD